MTTENATESRYAGPLPFAKLIHSTLKSAGLADMDVRVTSGRKNTWVRVNWDEANDRSEAVLAALRPLWKDGQRRVSLVWSCRRECTVVIRRNVWRTLASI
jgi:hypothetical protein